MKKTKIQYDESKQFILYFQISDSVSYEQYKWFTYDVIGDLWYFTIPDYKDNYYFENIINGGWSEWYQINECKADDGAVNFFRACTKPPLFLLNTYENCTCGYMCHRN